MILFSKLTQKAKQTYGVASKKTSELAKEAKLKMKMNENKAEINDLYKEIGKKVYERHTMAGEINIKTELEEECTKIDILSAEIETCLNEIRELKDKKQCPNCFNEISLDSNYCNHCGAKQEQSEEPEVEVINLQNSENDMETTMSDLNANQTVETTTTISEENVVQEKQENEQTEVE